MFIKDGVYRSVDVSGLTAPIAEGTILTETGAIAAANGSDAYGIVPENVYVMPPTKMINVAVGGIIDLLDPANANMTLSEAVMKKLGEDFNFVQFNEHTGGGGGAELPAATSADEGKVLTVQKTGYTKGTVIIPEQTLTTQGQSPQAIISNYDTDLWVIDQKVVVCINDKEYESVLIAANGIADFYSDDGYAIILEEGVLTFNALASDDYVVSAYICEDVYGYVPAGGGPWDAVIRLTHSNDSSQDLPANLTPSIVSGSHSELTTKINNGGYPCILVEYYHPWGYRFAVPMAYIYYASADVISIAIVGASPMADWAVSNWGELAWSSNDTIDWN